MVWSLSLFLSQPHCPNNKLNLRIKTEPVTAGANYILQGFVWFIGQILCTLYASETKAIICLCLKYDHYFSTVYSLFNFWDSVITWFCSFKSKFWARGLQYFSEAKFGSITLNILKYRTIVFDPLKNLFLLPKIPGLFIVDTFAKICFFIVHGKLVLCY